ncbi:MAG: hypothetical protein GY952_14385 [Rhodobacteraceae bacterium]|nr:hypothetical protein [Paracoccaceae bacterium]
MPEQLTFELPIETAFGCNDFFVSAANELAVKAVENWQNWPLGKTILLGPPGAGKTHLAHIWAGLAGGGVMSAVELADSGNEGLAKTPLCLDDVHLIAGNSQAEEALFHLHNLMQENGTPLLMTGSGSTALWGIVLPDLASRLQGSNIVELRSPDDPLLSALLIKLFSDRQLRIEPGLVTYLLPRMDRSFAEVHKLVAKLDQEALQNKRRIGVRMAGKTLLALQKETV